MFTLHDVGCPLGMTGTHHQQGKTSLICVARLLLPIIVNHSIEYILGVIIVENGVTCFNPGELKFLW